MCDVTVSLCVSSRTIPFNLTFYSNASSNSINIGNNLDKGATFTFGLNHRYPDGIFPAEMGPLEQ